MEAKDPIQGLMIEWRLSTSIVRAARRQVHSLPAPVVHPPQKEV